MKEPLDIIIFGDRGDERIIMLKCLLLKCGICNFAEGRLDICGRCKLADDVQPGLFIVSSASVSPLQIDHVHAEANRLAVPILQL